MDNIIRFPRRTGASVGEASSPTADSSLASAAVPTGEPLDEVLTLWSRRAVFQLPGEFTLQTTIDRDLSLSSRPVVDAANLELTAVLDALLAHCVACLGERGGELRINASLLHQPQRQELTYHGLRAGEYALVLFSANGLSDLHESTLLDAQVIDRVQAFGGQVHSSDQGALGLRLALHLPIVPPAITVEEQLADPVTGAGLHILLVDDDEQARLVVGQVLRQLGCSVAAFADGSAALDALARDPSAFQLVLSDLTMPHMSGAELTQRIRQRYSQLPIALMTGFSGPHEDNALEALGVFAVLEKPFGKKALLQLLQAAREELALPKTSS